MNSGQRLVGFCFGLACLTAAQLLDKMTTEFLTAVGTAMAGWIALKTIENQAATRTTPNGVTNGTGVQTPGK